MIALTMWVMLMILSITLMALFPLFGLAYPEKFANLISGSVFVMLAIKYVALGMFHLVMRWFKKPLPPPPPGG